MSKQYSVPEMQQQITQLTATMNLPGVPADEIAIYQTTIARIQAEINARTQPGPVTQTPNPTPQTPIKHNTPPPPPPYQIPTSQGMEEAIQRHEDRTNQHRQQQAENRPQIPITVRAPGKPDQLTPQQRTDLQNTHITYVSQKQTAPTAAIHWPEWDWGIRIYTERDARSALTTALRDLAESKRAQQNRLGDLPQYLAWWRAIQYYRALTYFWGSPPTRQELRLYRRDDRYITIFTHIQTAAQTLSIT